MLVLFVVLCVNESVLVVLTFVERSVVCEERVNVMLVCVTSRECIDLRARIGCLVACSIRLCLSRRHRRWATQSVTAYAVLHAVLHGFFFPPCVSLSEACVTRRAVESSFAVLGQSVFRRTCVAPRFPCMRTLCTRQHCCLFMEVLPILLLLRFL